MKIGIPTELKNHEYRVAVTPAGVHELVKHGHEVVVQRGAGRGSHIPDEEYLNAGAKLVDDADAVWGDAEMIIKVKEPIPEEYHRLREGQVLFTYLHLAASRSCTDALLNAKTTAIAYETVQVGGALPLLAPMSEIAGRLAPQVGAYHLMRAGGGRGVLPGGVPGVPAGRAVVIGGGVSGWNAAQIAIGMGFHVTLLDKDIRKLREADAELAQGVAVPEICKALGIAENTYYRWRNQFGGIKADEMKRLKELERENARLKALVADLSLDKAILKEAARGNS